MNVDIISANCAESFAYRLKLVINQNILIPNDSRKNLAVQPAVLGLLNDLREQSPIIDARR